MKQKICSSRRKLRPSVLTVYIVIVSFALSAYGQHQTMQMAMTNKDTMDSEEQEVAHPFFTHMGVPEAVGVFSLRLGGLITRIHEKTSPDFAFHFETGLTKFIGVHLRNNGIRNRQHTELMFQFAALRSKGGMSGFSPIIEFEFPIYSGGDRHINTLVGFSTALANSKVAFNQVLHFEPRTYTVEGSAAFVLKLGTRLFPVIEVSGENVPDEHAFLNLLGGLKVQVSKLVLLGIAAQMPVTKHRDFAWQLLFQPEIEWGKMK